MQLEAAKLLGGGRIGRATEDGRERPDMPNIVVARLVAEVAHGHVSIMRRRSGLMVSSFIGGLPSRGEVGHPSILERAPRPVTPTRSAGHHRPRPARHLACNPSREAGWFVDPLPSFGKRSRSSATVESRHSFKPMAVLDHAHDPGLHQLQPLRQFGRTSVAYAPNRGSAFLDLSGRHSADAALRAEARALAQERETIQQTRAGALAAAGYARKLLEEGNTRLGALVALGVIPASRRDDDPRYVREAEVAFAGALSLPVETIRLRGHKGSVVTVAFSLDGRRSVRGAGGPCACGMRTPASRWARPCAATRAGSSVAFSPDSRRIVSGSRDNTRAVGRGNRQACGRALRGHEDAVTTSPSRRRKRIVTGRGTTRAGVGCGTRQPVGEPLRGHEDYAAAVGRWPPASLWASRCAATRTWSPTSPSRGTANGRVGVCGQDGPAVGRCDRPAEGERCAATRTGVRRVAFSPDGKRSCRAGGQHGAAVGRDDRPAGASRSRPRGPVSVAFSPDGKRVASGSDDTTIRLWDAATGQRRASRCAATEPVAA